jgi:hypothetical protein
MGDLSMQNAGLEALIKQVLDCMNSMDIKVDGLQEQLASNSKRADLLEARMEDVAPVRHAPGKEVVGADAEFPRCGEY